MEYFSAGSNVLIFFTMHSCSFRQCSSYISMLIFNCGCILHVFISFYTLNKCNTNLWAHFFYCSENTKNVLIAASYIHLKHKEHVKYTSDLTTVNPRILLSGPAGVLILYYHYSK